MTEEEDVVLVGYVEHDEIVLDPQNANLGTERGMEVIERSLDKYGAGRSILLDRNNVDIAGNKTLEKWVAKGGKVFVVETDGTTLIAVRRRDLAVDEGPEARELATIDNRAAEINLSWDYNKLAELYRNPDIDLSVGFSAVELDDIAAHAGPPSLEDLEGEYGQPTEEDYYNAFTLKLPQELIDAYNDLVGDVRGTPVDKFKAALEWAQAGKAAT